MTGAGPNQLGVGGPLVQRTGFGGNFAHAPRARRHMNVTAATLALKDGDSGALVKLLRATGTAVTLPVTPRSGCFFEFFCGVTIAGGTSTITATSDELMTGGVENVDTDSSNVTVTYAPDLSNDVICTLNGGTQGGIKGSYLSFEFVLQADGSDGLWLVKGVLLASGAVATPFS